MPDGTIASIVQAPNQFAVWSGGSLTTSAQNNLDAALASAAGSKLCADLVNAIGEAITYVGAQAGTIYTDQATNLVPLAFNSGKLTIPSYMQKIGSFGDANVFYGVPLSDISQPLMPVPRPPKRGTGHRRVLTRILI